MADKPNLKSKIQTLAILTILIGFPLLSWYYLKTGYNYQMDARAEMKAYGEMQDFSFLKTTGETFSLDSIGEKLSVFSFLGSDGDINMDMLNVMKKLNVQFGDNRNLDLVIVNIRPNSFNLKDLVRIFDQQRLDKKQHQLLQGSQEVVQNWLGKGIKVPTKWIEKEDDAPDIILEEDKSGEIKDYPFLILVDKNHIIRNFYHVDNYEEIKRMVEHIALLLPRDVKPDIEMKEKKEM